MRITKNKPFPKPRKDPEDCAETVLRMDVGHSIRVENENRAKAFVRTFRRYGMRGIRRREIGGTYRVWRIK